MKRTLVLASRKSDLARIQAYTVGEAIQSLNPKLQIDYRFSASLGDHNLDLDPASMTDRGIFTSDFRKRLVTGAVDLVVHSWKDLPTKLPVGTEVVATLAREDMRDLLVIPKKHLSVVKSGGVLNVLSSSQRREYNLRPLIPKLWPHKLDEVFFKLIRGNVPTRFNKLFEGEGHALIVAKAAVDRMLATERNEFLEMKTKLRRLLDNSLWMVLPLRENPCAPAQGALAIEIVHSFQELKELLGELNCEATQRSVCKEREILASYGGGCHQKIGVSVFERKYGEILSFRGLTETGKVLSQWSLSNKVSFSGKVNYCDPRKNQWFERELLDMESTPFDRPVWIAKEEALPQGSICHHLIWTSGIQTWQKLARRGYWVNGSAESLGEKEDLRLQNLSGDLDWLKLTHDGALNVGDKESRGTYKLKPVKKRPTFTDETHFYWMSGSQFVEALRHYPRLKEAHHACGPGHTYEKICEILGDSSQVDIFLSFEEWEKACQGDRK